ncbi:NAD(P)-dependent oxidoreductase [Bacillus cereus group sp. BfR-BA-01441]|uniref:NAD-dependent epimerase/dehydratase family protein n=1 Tax=Bacillus cereus group sp. BfR-BA-01441 TaxID=2920348 RepID=UPI001F581CF4
MKILVTGGLGVVGKSLVKELRKRDHEVYIIDLPHHHDPKYFRCDISFYRQLENIFEKHEFDYVYNLAAEFGRWNGEDFYEKVWTSNVIGTKNIIRCQEKYGFKLIHFSSSEVYGDYEDVMYEDVLNKVAITQMNDYAMSKRVNEMQIKMSRELYNTETVIVRLFNTYGPGEYYSDYRSVICLFSYRALQNLPYTVYTNHFRTSTYIYDCIVTLANIVENFKAGETYNIGSDDFHDIKEASDIILSYLGKTDSLVTYKEMEPLTTKIKKVNIDKIKRDLNHKTTIKITEGIPLTIEWMKKIYK